MKKYNLAKNTISATISQLVTMICGLILPRLILYYYGSSANGLVNSISQFLSVIAFLELGVGAVTQTALYKPLVNGDIKKQSQIYVSAKRFFSKLAKILVIYVGVLIFIFPVMGTAKFNFVYTSTLIIAMGVSSFLQYYFGIVNSLFLSADQKSYIQYNLQIITLIINTIFSVILMIQGASLQVVKLSTAIIYCVRPLYLSLYVKSKYPLNTKIELHGEPIKQKWNGIAQHVAAIVLDGTDIIVLTVFDSLKDVSIYSVYYLVISAIKQMFNTVTSGIQSILGDLYFRGDREKMVNFFFTIEWGIHNATIFVMGCVSQLIVPFVMVYTNGVRDANYNQPLFGYIITIAYAVYCFRLPYHMMIRASGRYKETQNNYIYSAIVNVIISIMLVNYFGLIGVAIGTCIAMTYQFLWLALYVFRDIISTSKKYFVKLILVDIINVTLGVFLSNIINDVAVNSWKSWIVSGVVTSLIWGILILVVNIIFYKKYIVGIYKRISYR